jgi:hypothetical protein
MTAENVAGGSSFSPTIPIWVPKPVAQAARMLNAHYRNANNVDHNVVLERLITDERMRRVWQEFSKHRRDKETYRSTDSFVHSAEFEWLDSDSREDHQHVAMASLLHFALNLAVNAPKVITQKELVTVRSRELDKVAALRTAADEIRRCGPNQAAAKVNDDIAKNVEVRISAMAVARLVVVRDTGDAQARCFSLMFAGYCRQLFGSPMYGITAIFASVALGRDITPKQVEGWYKSHPPDKARR